MEKLLNILKNVQSWTDLYDTLCKKNNETGRLFEEFCKYYFITESSVCLEYKNIWLFNEAPKKVKEKLNLGKIDHGIDLILEDNEGYFTVVQCKFRSNQSSLIAWSKDKLANLFADGEKADFLMVFTNASGLDKYSLTKQSQKLKLITLGNLLEIGPDSFVKIKKYLLNQKQPKLLLKKPRAYQKSAIKDVIKGFKSYSRGQLILPCGAGKTLTALWIKEAMDAKKTLVMVPSLALLRQIKNEWSANLGRYVPYLCVCSEDDIDNGIDRIVEHTYDIQGNVTTEPSKIRAFIKKHPEVIIYSTYQSYEKIISASKGLKYNFDLAICDEAHKTAVSKLSMFGLIHDDSKLKILHRLYMTATPRITAANLKKSTDTETLEYVCDMSNPKIYGPEFHRMSFKEAIDQSILADYKIVAIGVSDKELQKAILQRRFTNLNTTIDEVANNYALTKFMKKYKANHAITFHSSIKKAQDFVIRHQELYEDVDSFHVNGKLTTNDRSVIMNEFEKSDKSVLSNARCLTEGIDVPAIDIVYFCDPKNSKIDIVQAAGRALRRSDKTGKEFGYIVVPIYHQHEDLLNETIEKGPFKNLLSVIRALTDQDERLVDEIRTIKLGIGAKRNNLLRTSLDVTLKLITMEGFEKNLDKKLFDQAIEKTPIPWRDFYAAREFIHTLNLISQSGWRKYCAIGEKAADIPANPENFYKGKGWKSWGDWLGTGRIADQLKKYRKFKTAKLFVHTLNLKNKNDWINYCMSGEKPVDIPSRPDGTYKHEGWESWGDWLGTGTIATFNRKYLPFKIAREYVHALNLKIQADWKMYCLSGRKPIDIPANPSSSYKNKGWKSWGDWLGNGKISNKDRYYLPFEKARLFVHLLKLKNRADWNKFCSTGNRPTNIPGNPRQFYKGKGWIGWGDWLGTGAIAARDREYRPFNEARKFVRSLKLNSRTDWKKYCAVEKKPLDIPSNPSHVYINEGWIGWGDWLGTGTIAPQNKEFRIFETAKLFVQTLNLKDQKDWKKYCASGKRPVDIPSNPYATYKNKGWISWGDWLGTGIISPQNREYRSFEEAKLFVHTLKLKSGDEWKKYCADGQKPGDIPTNVQEYYKNKGWISWGDWLGTGIIASYKREYRPFKAARLFVHSLNLKSQADWKKYCVSKNKPADIPANPYSIYKKEGWINWGDWFGSGTIAPKDRVYRPFKEAQKYIHSLKLKNRRAWRQYCANGEKPADIPSTPDGIYKNKGWTSWKDWLGST